MKLRVALIGQGGELDAVTVDGVGDLPDFSLCDLMQSVREESGSDWSLCDGDTITINEVR